MNLHRFTILYESNHKIFSLQYFAINNPSLSPIPDISIPPGFGRIISIHYDDLKINGCISVTQCPAVTSPILLEHVTSLFYILLVILYKLLALRRKNKLRIYIYRYRHILIANQTLCCSILSLSLSSLSSILLVSECIFLLPFV